jgi:hypothetical protein
VCSECIASSVYSTYQQLWSLVEQAATPRLDRLSLAVAVICHDREAKVSYTSLATSVESAIEEHVVGLDVPVREKVSACM